MLRVTRLTDYAALLMTLLAESPQEVHRAAALAERSRLEPTTVSKVLKALAQAGLVEGLRGVNGGYRIAREAERISLFEIVEAIEGRLEMTACSGGHAHCVHEPHCRVAPHWQRINDLISEALRDTTLAQMLEPRPGAQPRRIELRLAT